MSEKGSYYIVIPSFIRQDKRLSAESKILYGEIAAKCNMSGYCWASNKHFADILGVNMRSIQRYIHELKSLKYIILEAGDNDRRIFLTENSTTNLSPGVTVETGGDVRIVRAPHDTVVVQNKIKSNNKKNRNTVAGAAPRPAKAARKKKEKPAPKPKPDQPTAEELRIKKLYAQFIDIYDIWYKGGNDGTPPKYDKGNGNAMKSLIRYFLSIARARAKKDGLELDDDGIDQRALDGWRRVLDSWNVLDSFMRGKTRLLDINSNIQNIITAIKNANTSGKPGPPQQVHKNDIGMQNLLKRIREGEAAGPDATADGRAVG